MFSGATPTPAFVGEFRDTTLATSTNALTITNIGLTCETFTSRDGCTSQTTELVINGVPTVTPATATIQYVLFESTAPATSNLDPEYTNRLGIREVVTTQTTTTHTIMYDSVENKGYEGAFEVEADPACTIDVQVNAFGTIVVDEKGIGASK